MKNVEQMEHLEKQLESYRKQRDLDSIFSCAQELLKLAEASDNSYYQTISNYHIANTLYQRGKYLEALDYAANGIRHGEVAVYPFYLVQLHNLIGVLYGTLGDDINSVQYTLQAYYIAKKHGVNKYLHILINNLGVLFFDLGFYDIAYDYFCQSFQLRNIHSYDDLQISDGFNIGNLIGCCIHLKKTEDYVKWNRYYTQYCKRFTENTVKNDYLLYQIYQNYYQQDFGTMIEKINTFLSCCDRDKDNLHTFKDLLQIFKLSIEVQAEDMSIKVFDRLTSIIKQYPEYERNSELAKLQVKYYLTFNNPDMLNQSLLAYYQAKEKEAEISKVNLKQSLLTRIDLEKVTYEQEIILKKNDELRKNIEIEEFTKVLNKSSFRRYVEDELQNMHHDQYLGFFIVDIDKFKRLNDTKGHLYGDKILLELVDILKQNIRETDYIGRIGGDEFCILIKNVLSLDYLHESAVHLLNSIRKIQNGVDDISASIGISVTDSGVSYEILFKAADDAMYEVKKRGGNDYSLQLLHHQSK